VAPPRSRKSLVIALGVAAAVIVPSGFLVQMALFGDDLARTKRVTLPPPPPACEYGRQRTALTAYEDWPRTLLDTTFRLPRSYEPPDLVPATAAGVGTEEMRVRSFVVEDLKALVDAAEAAGNPVDITWGYRSFQTQRWVFEYWTEQKGDAALKTAARPGHSEHQLGTGLDFKTKGALNVDVGWKDEPAGRWMRRHAWEYGFVLSYPEGKESVTCYAHEPWHYRYFGRDVARRIHDSGLTPREYLWRRVAG
jgi:D-alanyl-D-alanine carboxypeptidase